MIEKIRHYSLQNNPTIYDEEALTALELAGRTVGKVNEVITDQNDLRSETENHLNHQDEQITNHANYIRETIPAEVERKVNETIQSGAFDTAISEYAGDLERRVENLFSTPTGGTTMDMEVVDIRMDENGNAHTSAGEAVREQTKRVLHMAEQMTRNNGVYEVPLEWEKGENNAYYVSKPLPLPKSGISPRITDYGEYTVNGVVCKWLPRVELGTISDGGFVDGIDSEHSSNTYNNRFRYIPYIEGVYFRVRVTMVGNSATQLNASNINSFADMLALVKVYAGKLKSSGNLLGHTVGTVVTDTAEKWKLNWGLRQYIHKFGQVTIPLPLQYVNRVVCNPDIWIGAKVYKFDPVSRATEWVKTLNFNPQHPCFGGECVIDFSDYGENYFAIVIGGHVPTQPEYGKNTYGGSTSGALNVTKCGLDASSVTDGIFVEWNDRTTFKDTVCGGSPVVQKNIAMLRALKHKTVNARYGHDNSSQNNYILAQNDFAGAFYGGGTARGVFFYNVSPATYYAALLNPNSNAYGDLPDGSGKNYGIMCSGFISLCHGYPLPLSTFDYRYNDTLPYFTRHSLNLDTDMDKLKVYDILTRGAGHTGHTVLLTGVTNVGDSVSMLNILECTTPSTRENVYFYHNGLNYLHEKPEEWYKESYDFRGSTLPEYDRTIHDKANWVAPYMEPQNVMCNRGYGGVYINGKNVVVLSVAPEVESVTISQNGTDIGTYFVTDISTESKNGYNLMDITHLVNPGTIRVRNNMDDTVEEFHVVDVSGYEVTATIGENVTLYVNKPNEVKYINVMYNFTTGEYAGTTTNVNLMPNFNPRGEMEIAATISTDIGELDLISHGDNWKNFINVVFKTQYDTNTFAIDAEGDPFN